MRIGAKLTSTEEQMLREHAANHFPLGKNENFDERLIECLRSLFIATIEQAALAIEDVTTTLGLNGMISGIAAAHMLRNHDYGRKKECFNDIP